MHLPAPKSAFSLCSKLILHAICFFAIFILAFTALQTRIVPVHAQTPTPGLAAAPNQNPVWVYDPEVTEVGKNAERSRQFLFWILGHPGIHTAPVFAKMWGITRNITYVFIVLVIVAFGIGLMLSRRAGSIGPLFNGVSSPFLSTNVPRILIKIGTILLYVTFSYILVLGIIQLGEVSMRFIKSLAGEELFNVIFAGSGNVEANYTNFIGFKDANPNSLEMVRTSLTLIRLTSLTYNVMAIILIVRTIVLWFMLILAPFLALLMPFVLIRNVGYIWIGVFFQWLFYGPLMLLFLVSLTNIWVAGIPYSFEFKNRINCDGPASPRPECTQSGQIYHTAINILYGGPAQTLSAKNTANYVDTYAEYVISLVMLWVAILLPWLLLRIFRDYCCEIIAQGNAKLASILDRLRQSPNPGGPFVPSTPTGTAGISMELPFRQRMSQQISDVTHFKEQTHITEIRDIKNTTTNEITRKMDMSVSSLKDVSRLEMNQMQRSHVEDQLRKIASPDTISSSSQRVQYNMIRSELESRAAAGDKQAAVILAAGENKTEQLVAQAMEVDGIERPTIASQTSIRQSGGGVITTTNESIISHADVTAISSQTSVSSATIQKISTMIPQAGTAAVSSSVVNQISQLYGMSAPKVQEVISKIQSAATQNKLQSTQSIQSLSTISTQAIQTISSQTQVSESKVREIINAVAASGSLTQQNIVSVAQKTNMPVEKVSAIVEKAQSAVAIPLSIQNISSRTQISESKVKEVIEAVTALGSVTQQNVAGIAQKTSLPIEKVNAVMKEMQVPVASPKQNANVTVEDYEEVKSMWLTHYRSAPVPLSESIKDRQTWLSEEEKKLTNISHLLSSPDPKLRQKGLEQVADILPFMLLGNFSSVEMNAYIKAKLEADKQVAQEVTMAEKVKKETLAQVKDEQETLLTVEKPKAAEAAKHMSVDQKMDLPKSE